MALSYRRCVALLIVALNSAALHAQEAHAPPDEKPLPGLHHHVPDLDRNQKAAEAAAEDYTYHVHRVVEPVDDKGNVKKTETFDLESLTVEGVRVNRLVPRDGKPLTPDEAKKESERIDKEVAKAKERRA